MHCMMIRPELSYYARFAREFTTTNPGKNNSGPTGMNPDNALMRDNGSIVMAQLENKYRATRKSAAAMSVFIGSRRLQAASAESLPAPATPALLQWLLRVDAALCAKVFTVFTTFVNKVTDVISDSLNR